MVLDCLELCEKRDPNLGREDALGSPLPEGEYARMRARLREILEETEDPYLEGDALREAQELYNRRLSFQLLAVVDAPADLRTKCLATRSAARRRGAARGDGTS
jgi:hypothetical protein